MSLIDELKKLIPAETIDGADVHETAKLVDLDVEYKPVVYDSLSYDPAKEHWDERMIPRVSRVQLDGVRYCVWLDDERKYAWTPAEDLKIMRARYLLLRGFYYRVFKSLPHSVQQAVLARFFPKGLFISDAMQALMDQANQAKAP